MSTGTTLTRPSLHLHMMTVSSTSGIQRLMHLHRNLRNLTFAKLMNCCTRRNKHKSRISRNIRYSAANSSQKQRWIYQLPLVRLNGCCFVYILDCVILFTFRTVSFCLHSGLCHFVYIPDCIVLFTYWTVSLREVTVLPVYYLLFVPIITRTHARAHTHIHIYIYIWC
jgi:hypothetical protein